VLTKKIMTVACRLTNAAAREFREEGILDRFSDAPDAMFFEGVYSTYDGSSRR
jgi:hypothetical protein